MSLPSFSSKEPNSAWSMHPDWSMSASKVEGRRQNTGRLLLNVCYPERLTSNLTS